MLTSAPLTLPALLIARASEQPTRTAISAADGTALTFADWQRRSDELATGLLDKGATRGDRIVIAPGNDWIAYAVMFLAVLKVGAIAVPYRIGANHDETLHVIKDCGATAVVTATTTELPPVPGVWVGDLDALSVSDAAMADKSRARDGAQILYTSGTTAQPKGVLATNDNLAFGCVTSAARRPLRHSEHFVHAFPIGTNAAATMLVNALNAYATAVCLPQFAAARFTRVVESMAAGTVFLVPSMAAELVRAKVAERFDVTSVRLVGCTADALPPALAQQLSELFREATIVNYYTSTEAAPAQTVMVFDPTRADSVGRSVSGHLSIRDVDGNPVAAGVEGDVWMKTDTSPRTYYGNTAANAQVFRGSWVRMGDCGRLDADGYLYLVDRESDLIKVGGRRVSTLHVEAALAGYDVVREAAVFGMPHPVLGTVVAAALVGDTEVPLVDVRSYLQDKLPPYELPSALLWLDKLPRNESGKVMKRRLRELATTTPEDEKVKESAL